MIWKKEVWVILNVTEVRVETVLWTKEDALKWIKSKNLRKSKNFYIPKGVDKLENEQFWTLEKWENPDYELYWR